MEGELRQENGEHGRETPPQERLVHEVVQPLREVPEPHVEGKQRKKDLRPALPATEKDRRGDEDGQCAAKERSPRP